MDTTKKKVYTVATAHLDTIWNWDFEKTTSQYIYDTLANNIKIMKEHPDYKFNFEGSYRYELMEEYYPELFDEMCEFVKKGQWHPCGSSFENGDVNVPSPEALFRNILIGNTYFEDKFGKRSCDIYLPDCFGFGYALPSIMHHANLKGFTTQKLTWGSAYGLPFDIGVWQGVDGNSVFASLNPGSYSRDLCPVRKWKFISEKLELADKYGYDFAFVFHGTGDRGGSPRENSINLLQNALDENKNDDKVEVLSVESDLAFRRLDEELTEEQKENLPHWNNELVMTNHGAGAYTSRAIGKRWNRRSEELASMAETAGVIADNLGVATYNRDVLTTAWKKTIAHQFHDDITGTSVQRAYKRSWNDYAVAMNRFSEELDTYGSATADIVDTRFCTGTPVVVFNHMEFERKENVKARIHGNLKNVCVFDSDGNEVEGQIIDKKDGYTEVLIHADVPSLGYRAYDVREGKSSIKSTLSIGHNKMENDRYIVSLDPCGNIGQIYDKKLQFNLLKEPITLGMYNYTGSKDWPAWEMNFKEANKKEDRIPSCVNVDIIENGPARVAYKVTQKDNTSEFRFIYALSKDSDLVEVYSEIEWQNTETLAKQKFSFTVGNDKATFDLGLGAIKRGQMNEKLFEVPAQKWADITDDRGKRGVSVISECKYGWDKYDYNTLRLTVLHTPSKNYRIDSMQSMMDLGLNRYSFAICSHEGDVGEETQMLSRRFVTPMVSFVAENNQRGRLGTQYSFGNVNDNSVIIRAIKLAEKSDEVVVRLNEGTNKTVDNFKLKLGLGIVGAREIYADETPNENGNGFTLEDGCLVTNFKPYEIKSFAIKLKKSRAKKTITESTILPLDFTKSIIARQGMTTSFNYSVPYEICPEKIFVNGTTFEINKDGRNTLNCENQVIDVPEGATKIKLLCGSITDTKQAQFIVDAKIQNRTVNSIYKRFACWDFYDYGQTAYISKGTIGYESTHAHDNMGEDAYAKNMWFYIVTLDVKDAKTVTLPDDDEIIVIAASADYSNSSHLATATYDEVENNRPFTFKMSLKQKQRYILHKMPRYINDHDEYPEFNNYGKDY